MPRYYFHIRDGDTLILDDDGCELADVEATRAEALDSARDLRRQDATDHFFTSKAPYIAVCDARGNMVLTQPSHPKNGEG
jgi:Domain of unknown function (DUF6894)